jgi:amidase
MLGIPVLLKDNITAGPSTHTTAGAAVLADWRPPSEARLVTNLRSAGAIVLGKTNMSEWANYMDRTMPNGYSVVGGQTRNPYAGNETYGSSSGSAVAASARFAALTVGTETQGSLILPAQINSAVTIRPSGGLISQAGIIPLYARQDTAGPMAQNVTDLAYGLNAMVGPDSADPRSKDAAAGHKIDFVAALKIDPSVKIGVPITAVSDLGGAESGSPAGPDDIAGQLKEQEIEARKADIALADALEAAGATVVRLETVASVPEGDITELLAAGFRSDIGKFLSSQKGTPVKSLAEIVAFNQAKPAERAPYGQGLLQDSEKSTMTDAEILAKGAAVEAEARKAVDEALTSNKVDVVFVESQAYAQASTPAVAIRKGYNKEGVPKGATLIGRYLEDAKVLSAAFAVEKALHAWKPPVLK